jgi:hypothetical protein
MISFIAKTILLAAFVIAAIVVVYIVEGDY